MRVVDAIFSWESTRVQFIGIHASEHADWEGISLRSSVYLCTYVHECLSALHLYVGDDLIAGVGLCRRADV